MLKVMTILGTRPEIIKMSQVIKLFDKNTNHILVHTGQNYDYELNQIFFDQMGIRKPDYFLDAAGVNPSQTIGQIIIKIDDVLEKEKPDAILIYGDTNSGLAIISAKRRKIPIFHMEAGNRCFDQRVPEELNRKVIDHLSDINLVLSEHARRYLIAEGIPAETIFKTGSHLPEVLSHYSSDINDSKILNKLNLEEKKYFLVSIHREENVENENSFRSLINALNKLANQYQIPIIVSTHPRTRHKINSFVEFKINERIKFCDPFGYFDYIKLQINALCILSDSGTIAEETSILGLRSIMIREVHERPEIIDSGLIIMCGLNADDILDSINLTIQNDSKGLISQKVDDYTQSNVSQKILKIVLSYTNYINRTVWKK
ncbi:UDP-N-acetylglucosamine 2-epimerase (non-hydrolyzing) [Polynucleobacter sp. IMCC30063]|uniref:non-hydrolyzing UDP-N-acetylglucosamine 2-epimerase n=1 Tax=Polynucleobacter sp. IMCC30063 TaxID=2907298 RepID=UPI001F43B085|nr:UDP-N-acetylglucosamine 2-epimerase (non-hydrolyzing) [Polynucleobacter sp. IMCC30063]MCE7505278.1 UDP-N-acetylglucosamine 2-epimerase (non-hydrolyzing) [Polynucleobacter sp. IMCC30063]